MLLIIFKQPDANVIETVDRIRAILPQTEKWLPPSVKVNVIISDRTVTIRASVEEVQFSLLLSIALVVLVIYVFLRRFWPTFIASVTVPLSLAGTFAVMYLLGYSLDNLSLMAVTISVGFVVDDAIVVIENVFRFIEAGDKPLQAALKGARQIGFTVVSMSLSLVAVFIPLLFMGGLIGRLFHEFAVTLSAAILVSGVISLTLTPMMCSRFLKPESEKPGGFSSARARRASTGCSAMYERGLRWVLRHQIVMLGVAVLTDRAHGLALQNRRAEGILPAAGYRHDHVPDRGVAGYLVRGDGEAAAARLRASSWPTPPWPPSARSSAAALAAVPRVNNGRMFIALKPMAERQVKAEEVIARLRRKLACIRGITLFHAGRGAGHPRRRTHQQGAVSIRPAKRQPRRAERVGAQAGARARASCRSSRT